MRLATAVDAIKARQREWAARSGCPIDGDGYCLSVDDNLFGGLTAGARHDFEFGDGSELGKGEGLHSSQST